MAPGQCDGQFEPLYGCAAAVSRLHERAMDRRSETRPAIRCQHCFPYLRRRPTEGSGAVPEGGTVA